MLRFGVLMWFHCLNNCVHLVWLNSVSNNDQIVDVFYVRYYFKCASKRAFVCQAKWIGS